MNNNNAKTLIQSYFKNHSFVKADLESFNSFIDKEMVNILEQNKIIEPTIIPSNIDDFKIRLDKIWVTKPEMIEADGSKKNIYPMEARLRKLTYAAPIYLEVTAHINDVQRESFMTQIGNMPIMLKSSYCHLNKMSTEELIKHGEDPNDLGGYFIVNGSEKVLVDIEDLQPNKFMVHAQNIGIADYVGKIFSESGSFKIPHTIEKLRDGLFYLTFTRIKKVPLVIIVKALGLLKDEEIMKGVSDKRQFDDILVNLFEFTDIKTEEDALDKIAKAIGITQSKEIRIQRVKDILNRYLLPHLGNDEDAKLEKAYNLLKMVKKYILVSNKEISTDDKDHYLNKKLKLPGDLLADLFMVNLKVLISDLLYNFQRIVKRGKFPSIKVIIRDKLLTQRIYSSMATGNWVGGRSGISQRMDRMNDLATTSHLQRVISPLSATQENFEARELHATHYGRLCPIETPEGSNIGLRKNLALMAQISSEADEKNLIKSLKNMGLKVQK
jgi:DNA-directed RNA polymerase beta subunit